MERIDVGLEDDFVRISDLPEAVRNHAAGLDDCAKMVDSRNPRPIIQFGQLVGYEIFCDPETGKLDRTSEWRILAFRKPWGGLAPDGP
jgi:hypothetical protein